MVNHKQAGQIGTRGPKTAGRPHKEKTEDRPLTQKEAVLSHELSQVRAGQVPVPVFRNSGKPTPGSVAALLVDLVAAHSGKSASELTGLIQEAKPHLDLTKVTTELVSLVHKKQLRRERVAEAWQYFTVP